MLKKIFKNNFFKKNEGKGFKNEAQLEFLRDFLSKHNYVFSDDFEENLEILKKKHLVDSFTVTNFDGSVVVNSSELTQSEGIMGTAMFSYIKSELPDSETVLIKRENNWFMIFSLGKRIFIVNAGSELSSIELKTLALELSTLLETNKNLIKEKGIMSD